MFLANNEEFRFYVTRNEIFEGSDDFIEKAELSNIIDYGMASVDSRREVSELITIDEIDNENNWKKRYFDYIDIYTNEIMQLDLKINSIKKENVESLSLSETYKEYDVLEKIEEKIEKINLESLNVVQKDDLRNIRKIMDNKLLLFCIKNQYIDEYYELYISNVTLDNISIIEYNYILDVKTGLKKKNYYTKLENLDIINSKLNDKDFNDSGVLNVYLLDHLLKNKDMKNRNKKMIENIVELLENENYEFFDYLILNLDSKEEFINELILINDNFWDLIIKNNEYTERTLIEYITIIIENASAVRIYDILNKNNVIKYINKIKRIDVNVAEKLVDSEIWIRFENIEEFSEEVLRIIVNFDMYEINRKNIDVIIEKVLLIENIRDIKKRGFSILKNNDSVYQYVLNNINDYIEKIYLTNSLYQENDEEEVISMLNNEKIDFGVKQKIIVKESTGAYSKQSRFLIGNLNDINDVKLYRSIIINELVKISYKNINVFYEECIKDEKDKETKKNNEQILIDFINKNYKKIPRKEKIDNKSGILDFLFWENKLSLMSYKKIINDSDNVLINTDITNLDLDKQEYIIIKKRLKFKLDYFIKITTQNNKNLTIKVIEKYKDDLKENIEDIALSSRELVWVFESNLDAGIKNIFLQDICNYNYDNFISDDMNIIVQKILNTDMEIDFSQEKIIDMIDKTKKIDLKIKLVNKYIKLFDKKSIIDVTSRHLSPRHKTIIEKDRQLEFEKTDELIEFIENINKICGFNIQYSDVKNRKIKIKKDKGI